MEDRIKKIVTDREWLTYWLADAFDTSPWFKVAKYYPPSTSSSDVCREEKWASALLNGGYIVVDDPEENKRYRVTPSKYCRNTKGSHLIWLTTTRLTDFI